MNKFEVQVTFKAKKIIRVNAKNAVKARVKAEKELQNIKLTDLDWEYIAEEPKEFDEEGGK